MNSHTHKPVTACPYIKDASRFHADITYTDPRTGKEVRVRRVAPKGLTLEGAIAWGEGERLRIVTGLARAATTETREGGEAEKKKTQTLAQIWPEFESDYIAEQSLSTQRNYEIAWRLHLSAVKDMRLDEIDESTLKTLKAELKKKGLKVPSIKKILEGLSKALKWCCGTKLPRDYQVPRIKWPKREDVKKEVYTKEQLEAFIAAARRHQDRVLALLLTDGALRIGEPAGLQWSDIDLEARTMWIRRNVCKRKLQERTKGGKAACLPLSGRLRDALRALKDVSSSPWVLPNKDGGHTTDRALQQIVRRLQRRAGLPLFGPHRIRHSVLTLAALLGATPYALQKWARHSNMRTTMGYYVHLDSEIAASAIACIAGPTPVPTPTPVLETAGKRTKRPMKKAA